MRLVFWVCFLLCSGSLVGYRGYKRWKELGDDAFPATEQETNQVWENTTDGAIARVREAVEDMEAEAKMAALKTKMAEVGPETALAHYLRGWFLDLEGQPEKFEDAVSAFTNACMADPKAMFPHYSLGLLYFEYGHMELAMAEFETAISNNSRFADAHFGLGGCFHRIGDLEAASNSYDLAIKLDPTKASYHFNMGMIYEQQGRLIDAIGMYTRCIQLDPSLPEAYCNLGRIQEAQGQTEEALRMYRMYLEREQDSEKKEAMDRKLRQITENNGLVP